MPASSSSFAISTSIYLLSSTLFLGLAYSPVEGSVRAAEMIAVRNVADSLQWQLDSLSPGIVAPLSWTQVILLIPTSVSLSGQSVTVSFKDIIMTRHVRWLLPNLMLDPSRNYLASIEGDRVSIETNRLG